MIFMQPPRQMQTGQSDKEAHTTPIVKLWLTHGPRGATHVTHQIILIAVEQPRTSIQPIAPRISLVQFENGSSLRSQIRSLHCPSAYAVASRPASRNSETQVRVLEQCHSDDATVLLAQSTHAQT